jgi:hypothetical protein
MERHAKHTPLFTTLHTGRDVEERLRKSAAILYDTDAPRLFDYE